MRLREHVTVQVFGWLVVVRLKRSAADGERLIELVLDQARHRAWLRFQKQRWKVTVRSRAHVEYVRVHADDQVERVAEHRAEPVPGPCQPIEDAYARIHRDVSAYEPTDGMRSLAGLYTRRVVGDVRRKSEVAQQMPMDHDDLDELGAEIAPEVALALLDDGVPPAPITRAIRALKDDPFLAQVVALRWARQDWHWDEIAAKMRGQGVVNRRGGEVTAVTARKAFHRLADGEGQKIALDDSTREALILLKRYTRDDEPAEQRAEGPVVTEAEARRLESEAGERLRALARGPRLTYLAVVTWAHDEKLQHVVDLVWQREGVRTTTREIEQRRKAVLEPLSRAERIALRAAGKRLRGVRRKPPKDEPRAVLPPDPVAEPTATGGDR